MTDRRGLEAGSQPPLLYPPYKSTVKRAPAQPLVIVPERFASLATPVYGYTPVGEIDSEAKRSGTMTRGCAGARFTVGL